AVMEELRVPTRRVERGADHLLDLVSNALPLFLPGERQQVRHVLADPAVMKTNRRRDRIGRPTNPAFSVDEELPSPQPAERFMTPVLVFVRVYPKPRCNKCLNDLIRTPGLEVPPALAPVVQSHQVPEPAVHRIRRTAGDFGEALSHHAECRGV